MQLHQCASVLLLGFYFGSEVLLGSRSQFALENWALPAALVTLRGENSACTADLTFETEKHGRDADTVTCNTAASIDSAGLMTAFTEAQAFSAGSLAFWTGPSGA